MIDSHGAPLDVGKEPKTTNTLGSDAFTVEFSLSRASMHVLPAAKHRADSADRGLPTCSKALPISDFSVLHVSFLLTACCRLTALLPELWRA